MIGDFRPNVNLEALGEYGTRVNQLIPQIRTNFDVARELTERLNPERKLNQNYYLNLQWSFWDGDHGEIRSNAPVGEGGDLEPVTMNVVALQLDARVANMVNATPVMDVTAATNEMADIAAANLANDAAHAMWHHLALSDVHARGHKVAGTRYNCFLKTLFDPYAGDIGEDGNPMGEIACEIVPPERVFVDPLADRVMPERTLSSDARWLYELCVQDVGFLVNHPTWSKEARQETTQAGNTVIYGGVPPVEEITPCDSTAASDGEQNLDDTYQKDSRRASEGASTFAKKGDPTPKGKVVRIVYYYEHKSPTYPHGRFAAFLPDNGWHVLEYRDELPYATKEHKTGLFPWVMYVDVFVPGKLTGRCRMSGARPLQDELNIAATSWRQTRGAMPPMILADRNSSITAEKLRGASVATIFEYDSAIGGNAPTVTLPSGVTNEAQLAMAEIQTLTRMCEDQMDAHTVSAYPRNSATTLGELEIMRLEDETKLKTNDVKRAEQTVYAPHMKLVLRMMQRFYTEPRMLMFFGADGKGSLRRFLGSELHFKDVRIVPGSSTEASRSLKVALSIRYMELMAATQMQPEEAKQFRLDMAQMLDLQLTHAMTTDQLQAKKQRDECFRMIDGERGIVPGPFDDHAIHRNEIARCALSPEVENLPQPKKNNVLEQFVIHDTYHAEGMKNTIGRPEVAEALNAALSEEPLGAQPMQPPAPMPGMPPDIGGGELSQTAPTTASINTSLNAGAIPQGGMSG